MSEYTRTTRECSVSQLHPELLRAIQDYFREYELGDPESATSLCCETTSKKNASKIGSWLRGKLDTTIYTGMILTSQSLIWVHYGDKSGTLLNTANLNGIRARLHTSLFTKDGGLEIEGYIGDANTRVRGYIAMATDSAAQKFCEAVQQAITKINPPTQKGFFGWRAG